MCWLPNLRTVQIAGPDWYKIEDPTSTHHSVWQCSAVYKDVESMGLIKSNAVG